MCPDANHVNLNTNVSSFFPLFPCASVLHECSRSRAYMSTVKYSAHSLRNPKIGEMRACPRRKLCVFTKVGILSQARKPTSTCNTLGGRSGTVNWTEADGAFRTCNNYLIVTICRNVDPFWLGNSRWNILFSLIDIFLGVWILNISFWNLNGSTCSLARASQLSSTRRSHYFSGSMGARKIKTVCKIFAINTACKRFQTMVWTPLIWLDDQMDARPS
jgi:hypothetical protein